jgi:hypothetical protein
MICVNIPYSFNDQSEEEEDYNGQLMKEGVSIDEWNEFLSQEHKFKGMLWFDSGKVC